MTEKIFEGSKGITGLQFDFEQAMLSGRKELEKSRVNFLGYKGSRGSLQAIQKIPAFKSNMYIDTCIKLLCLISLTILCTYQNQNTINRSVSCTFPKCQHNNYSKLNKILHIQPRRLNLMMNWMRAQMFGTFHCEIKQILLVYH